MHSILRAALGEQRPECTNILGKRAIGLAMLYNKAVAKEAQREPSNLALLPAIYVSEYFQEGSQSAYPLKYYKL